MCVLVFAFISMVTAGIAGFVKATSKEGQPRQPTVFYEDAGKSLPVLEALAQEQVTFLRVQDWCRAYADKRELRATPVEDTCTAPGPGTGETAYKPFDDASEKRFLELQSKLDALPYDVTWITIEYGPGGGLREAVLSIKTTFPPRYDSLIYDPGYTLPANTPGQVMNHRIDTDWYYRWEDWM